MKTRTLSLLLVAMLFGVAALSATASYAKRGSDDPAGDARGGGGGGDDGRIERSGSCSGRSNWKLKAKPDDGRLEVEFEVDQNRTGVRWKVRIRQNGRLVVNTARRTVAPSGSFSLERRLADRSGQDRLSARATRNGETCSASLTI